MANSLPLGLSLEPEPRALCYAGFWRRLIANGVDGLITLAVGLGSQLLFCRSKTWWTFGVVPTQVLLILYVVVLHARYGQTFGKMVARIRIVTPAGNPISARHALWRSSVDIVFGALIIVDSLLILRNMPSTAWGHGLLPLNLGLAGAQPAWSKWAHVTWHVWFWSEILVLLLDRKRRALHDFIAGTVVVRLP